MQWFKWFLLALWLIGLPLVGVLLAGHPLAPFLAFPPIPQSPHSFPVSWVWFGLLVVLILAVLAPFLYRMILFSIHPIPSSSMTGSPTSQRFPWWGWLGICLLLLSWILAWTRFPWFHFMQSHTFTPLWLSYILLVNGLTWKRTGHCWMVGQTKKFLALFPLSAGFWWYFEYLNRFVHTWHYVGTQEFNAVTYFWFATISFSTVLPSVAATHEWLQSFPRLSAPFRQWKRVPLPQQASFGWALLLLGSLTLLGLGLWPEILYPFLWISPLLILFGLQQIQRDAPVLASLRAGDWRPVTLPALAGLLCGGFWEMWNFYSLAHWEYTIPYVHSMQVFEMPLLGYAGYLPFGLECLALIQFVTSPTKKGGRECLNITP